MTTDDRCAQLTYDKSKPPVLEQQNLTGFEQTMARNAHHRALIMRILMDHPEGLTTQEIVAAELEYFKFTFLTDNRLRELRAKGWVECVGEKPQRWRKVSISEN